MCEMTYLVAIREMSDKGLEEEGFLTEIEAVPAKFQDVMPKELPKQLPPRREVDYVIQNGLARARGAIEAVE